MQTRISRACVAAAKELDELYVCEITADDTEKIADIIYKHIQQVLMEDYDASRK